MEVNEYGYDSVGNRTSWDVTGGADGDSALVAQFNAAGQLTGTVTSGDVPGSASYSFDGAGNWSGQTVDGQSMSFTHDLAGALANLLTYCARSGRIAMRGQVGSCAEFANGVGVFVRMIPGPRTVLASSVRERDGTGLEQETAPSSCSRRA